MTDKKEIYEDYYDATTGDVNVSESDRALHALDWSKLDGFTFVRGAGSLENKQACLFTAASVLGGYAWTDHIPCVCPVITDFGIRLSDIWHDDTDREAFVRKYAPLVLNTRSTHEVERKRLDLLARAAMQRFVPMAFDSAANVLERRGKLDHAAKLRDFATRLRADPSIELTREARSAAAAAAAAAAYAYAAAAYAAAAYDADAAAAAAYAAAYDADAAAAAAYAADAAAYDAAAAAAAAAYAAAYAADAAAYDAAAQAPFEARQKARAEARRGLRVELLKLFDEVIAVTEATP